MGRMLKALKQLESQLPHWSAPPHAADAALVADEQEHAARGIQDLVDQVSLRGEVTDSFSAAICQFGQAIEVLPGAINLPTYPELALSTPEASPRAEAACDMLFPEEDAFRANRADVPSADSYEGLARQIVRQLRGGSPAVVTLVSLDRVDPLLAIVVPLAAALAAHSGPMLVVDGDLREPTLGERFAVPTERGLIDLLPGPARWQEVVRPTQLQGVDLLPGRHLVAADGRAPEHLDLAPLVEEWLGRYRLVLLAAGPLDSPQIGSLLCSSHAALLVVELGRNTHRAGRKAVRAIRCAGAQLLGSIAVEAA